LSSHLTIKNKAIGNHQVKGSKYLGFAYPIINLNQVKFFLQELKSEYSDASHICYAYRILNNNNIDEFSTDAGEPRGSAGLPILNVLKSKKLINTAIYVVRYYGGSKLGIPGLIQSYSRTAEHILENSILTSYIPFKTIEISFEMKYHSRIEALIEKYNGISIHKDFFSEIIYSISLPSEKKNSFLEETQNITNGSIKILKNSF
tara:strand:- start:96 stop:707 length:612 start_codon:yes stop_codon:yes gene_type:complete